MKAPLYFVRHGETDWNAQGRLQGGTDIPLNGTGRAQAETVGRLVAGLDPAPATFVSSPLGRARETMELLRGVAGLAPAEYRTDERLSELRFGAWEGATWRELRRTHGRLFAERERDLWTFVPPGSGAESYRAVAERVRSAMADIDGPALVVSHGGVARAAMVVRGGRERAEALRAPIWQGRILRFDEDGCGWL